MSIPSCEYISDRPIQVKYNKLDETQYYSNNWFEGNIEDIDLHLKKFKGNDNLNFLEIGCYEGRSCVYLVEKYLTGSNCKLLCVDSFNVGSSEELSVDAECLRDRFNHNTKHLMDIIDVEACKLSEELSSICCNVYDFIHVDYCNTNHTEMLFELQELCYSLKPGGCCLIEPLFYINSTRTNSRWSIPVSVMNKLITGLDDKYEHQIKLKTDIHGVPGYKLSVIYNGI